ncbi:MAG: Plug domain-containing protein [Chlorobi bacterium CHB2]|nr:Plug domain-containing protein [Chlorobi bacterium CHB2]
MEGDCEPVGSGDRSSLTLLIVAQKICPRSSLFQEGRGRIFEALPQVCVAAGSFRCWPLGHLHSINQQTTMKRTIPIALLALCAAGVAQAQQPAMPDTARVRLDTLKTYRLGEVIVRGEHDATVGSTTVQRIAAAKIIASDAPTADRLAPIMPATRIQTNSRGEAILYMRNAGERQTAIFLDGALINIPWDNRVDLSLIPMNSIGGVTMSKGVASVLYGSNILGGAVEFVSQELSEPGFLTDVSLTGGDHGAMPFPSPIARCSRWMARLHFSTTKQTPMAERTPIRAS